MKSALPQPAALKGGEIHRKTSTVKPRVASPAANASNRAAFDAAVAFKPSSPNIRKDAKWKGRVASA